MLKEDRIKSTSSRKDGDFMLSDGTIDALAQIEQAAEVLQQQGFYNEFKVIRCLYLNIYNNTNGSLGRNLINIIKNTFDTSVEESISCKIKYDELGIPKPASDCDT